MAFGGDNALSNVRIAPVELVPGDAIKLCLDGASDAQLAKRAFY